MTLHRKNNNGREKSGGRSWLQQAMHDHDRETMTKVLAETSANDVPMLTELYPIPDLDYLARKQHEIWADEVGAILDSMAIEDDGSGVVPAYMVDALVRLHTVPYEEHSGEIQERTRLIVFARMEGILICMEAMLFFWGLLNECGRLAGGVSSSSFTQLTGAVKALAAQRYRFLSLQDNRLYYRVVSAMNQSDEVDGSKK